MCKIVTTSHALEDENSNYSTDDLINFKMDRDKDEFYGSSAKIPFALSVVNFIAYSVLIFLAYTRKYFSTLLTKFSCNNEQQQEKENEKGQLYNSFEHIYRNYFYYRFDDCFTTPITSMATSIVTVMEQVPTSSSCPKLRFTGGTKEIINLGSYNYLGMNQNTGPIAEAVEATIKSHGFGTCSSRNELGTLNIHCQLEELFSSFLRVEDCITFGMGFATNTLNIPPLIGPNCLVLSDEKNHASILLGCKNATSSIKQVFKHNDMNDLEDKLRMAIVRGNPRINRPYRKIIVIVEAIYSMEGTICKLRKLIELKKKYKFYLYVDEAHSIGAIGHSGRGVCELLDVDPNSVDILMGTFTKSFAGTGGYIAGSKKLINYLRINSPGCIYPTSMSPAIVQQIISSLKTIMDPLDGRKKCSQLAWNTRYFRNKVEEKKLMVIGSPMSPVIPIVLVGATVGAYVHRIFKARGIGAVIAGFPATEVNQERIRVCLSSDHTKEMLDHVLDVIFDLTDRGVIPKKSQ